MLMRRIVEIAKLDISENQTISISFVGPKTIAKVNKDFVNHSGLTDVISFDYRDPYFPYENDFAAELIIHPGMAVRESAVRKNSSFAYEMVLYLVHGILHIAGENDLSPKERTRMRKRERFVIKKLQKEFIFESIFQKKVVFKEKYDN